MNSKLKGFIKAGIAGTLIAVVLVVSSFRVSVNPDNGFVSFGSSIASAANPVEIITDRTIASKTYDLGNGQRRLSTSIGVIHYKDNLGVWQDVDEAYSEVDGAEGFSAKFTRVFSLVRIKEDGSRRIYPDRNDLSYWIQIEKPTGITMGTPVKSGNTWTWDFLHAQIKIQIQSARVKFSFILKDALAPTSITIPFSVQGITRTGNILYHNGEPIAELAKPVAIDANHERRDATAVFGAGQVTISLDTTGLTFPIDIDPTLNLQVGASADDSGTCYWNGSVWTLSDITEGQFRAGYEVGGAYKEGSAARWQAAIPQGATITTATMTLRASFTRTGTTVNSRITGVDVDNAAAWTNTLADYQALRGTVVGGATDNNITTAVVDWDNIAAWSAGADYTSPELKTVIQEIINRAGWASGNYLGLFWDDHANRSTAGGNIHRVAATYDGGVAPKLDITYTEVPNYTANQTTYSFGIVQPSTTTNTSGNWILFTNSSTVSTNISVKMLASTWTSGGTGWTHSDTAAGVNTVAMKANSSNSTTWASSVFIKFNSPFNEIASNVAAATNIVSGLSLLSPTSMTDGYSNNNTIRFSFYAATP